MFRRLELILPVGAALEPVRQRRQRTNHQKG
jgi:hypothetical protein